MPEILEKTSKILPMIFGLKLGQAMVYAGIIMALLSAFQFSGSAGDYISFTMTGEGQARLERMTWMLIIVGVLLQTYRTYVEGRTTERREVRASTRVLARDKFEPSERLIQFSNEVLSDPIGRAGLVAANFTGYAKATKPELHSLLMQATADQCVLCALATRDNGIYRANNDKTVTL